MVSIFRLSVFGIKQRQSDNVGKIILKNVCFKVATVRKIPGNLFVFTLTVQHFIMRSLGELRILLMCLPFAVNMLKPQNRFVLPEPIRIN